MKQVDVVKARLKESEDEKKRMWAEISNLKKSIKNEYVTRIEALEAELRTTKHKGFK